METYAGHCHCGLQAFEYSTRVAPADWSVRACQCSFCRMRDATYTSDPQGQLRWTRRDDSQLARYRFGHATADFQFCLKCGTFLGAEAPLGETRRAVICVHAFDPRPAGMAAAVAVSFDGETADARDGRHAERWTPVLG